MILSEDRAEPIGFKVKEKYVRGLAIFCLIAALVCGASLLYSLRLTGQIAEYNFVKFQNAQSKRQLLRFNENLAKLNRQLDQVVSADSEIRATLGLKPVKFDGKVARDRHSDLPRQIKIESLLEVIRKDLAKTQKKISERERSYNDLRATVHKLEAKFAATPSIWPVAGYISSAFGYRVSPWQGFHAGVDIPTWYGAPIRVTADGVVERAGWESGLGLTVTVAHGNGLETVYGHNSALLVGPGTAVRKGQTIAQAGQTGFATGVHSHYEVRRNGAAINPTAYMGLSI